MGMRSGTTFKKRQKELARMEKQRDKAARRMQRKVEKQSAGSTGTPAGEVSGPSGAVLAPQEPATDESVHEDVAPTV